MQLINMIINAANTLISSHGRSPVAGGVEIAMLVAAVQRRLYRRLVGDCLITASADPVDGGAYQTEHQTLQAGGA